MAAQSTPPPDAAPPVGRPASVRTRVIALTAQVLPLVSSLPPVLRKVSAFAPARRARLGASQIDAVLETDDDFRSRVGTQVAAAEPALGDLLSSGLPPATADPVDAAALLWLVRPEGWEDAYADAVLRVEERAAVVAAGHDVAQAGRLALKLAEAERELREVRDRHRDQLEELKAENVSLRQKLGESRVAERTAKAAAGAAAEAEAALRATMGASTTAGEAESRRLRTQIEELTNALTLARRETRSDKDAGTLRARILLDTVLEAAAGLRRELALPTVSGAPADQVEAQVEEAGARIASPATVGPSSPALLEQLLAMPRARLIVDGYNVSMAAWPTSPLEAQRLRLLNAIAPLVARSGAETTIVFDAAAAATRPVLAAPRGVKVLFSPEGVIADDVIRDLVGAEPAGRVVIVVSSDREIARDVVRSGARALESEALIQLLTR